MTAAGIHVGVVPYLGREAGGIYHYSLTALEALHGYGNDPRRARVTILTEAAERDEVAPYLDPSWAWSPVAPTTRRQRLRRAVGRLVGEGPHRDAWRALRRAMTGHGRTPTHPRGRGSRVDLTRWYRDAGLQMMYYPTSYPPLAAAFEVDVPYVLTIHDLEHRRYPDLPEFLGRDGWDEVEYWHREGARFATLIVVDSEVGRQDVMRHYGPHGAREDRIRVLPYIPPPAFRTPVNGDQRRRARADYGLPDRYLFYPAQFWSHKNHVRIVEAVAAVRARHGIDVAVVFCGSRDGPDRQPTHREVVARARALGVGDRVIDLGFVPNDVLPGLYAGAVALVMPTLFGPSNLPILEAWAAGCPVITSNIRGVVEQVAGAGILVDPQSVDDIAEAIRKVWSDDRLGAELADAGRRRLALHSVADFRTRLHAILDEAAMLVRDGGRLRR